MESSYTAGEKPQPKNKVKFKLDLIMTVCGCMEYEPRD